MTMDGTSSTELTLGGIEEIETNGVLLAIIVRRAARAVRTMFVTDDSLLQQVGFVVYPEGGEVSRHVHVPLERSIRGTSEVLIVREGRCVVDLYDEERRLVDARELTQGDVILLIAGGHGFRMLEDTVFLEVKQGPYTGIGEKETF
jgi:hypothetical protein